MTQKRTLSKEEKLDYTKNTILLSLLLINCFLVTLLPVDLLSMTYRIAFTLILIATYTALESMYRQYSIPIILLALVLYWFSYYNKGRMLDIVSNSIIAVIFLSTVINLLKQVSSKERASIMTIIQALSGYLLVGIVLALAFSLIGKLQPESFNFSAGLPEGSNAGFHNYLYFTFISMGTVGFGDLLPLTPFARSFTSFAGIAGQIYIAIVIAMLIGKFTSK